MGRPKTAGRKTWSDKGTRRMDKWTKKGRAKLAPSPLGRREKELLLHLGPEGAPWGQPSERRALRTKDKPVNF